MLKLIVLMKSRISVGTDRAAIGPNSVPLMVIGKDSELAIIKDTQA